MQIITKEHLQKAVDLQDFDHIAAQARKAPIPRGEFPQNAGIPPRNAGVLVLIFPDANQCLQIVLTKRTDNLRGHSGQISFPGGRRDAEDKSFTDTALRETCEELGVCEPMEVLGELTPIYIPPSHFNVYPTVAMLDMPPIFKPNPDEVAETFTFAVHDLLDEQYQEVEYRYFGEHRFKAPYYKVNGHKVWGATAIMLSELEHRLRHILRSE